MLDAICIDKDSDTPCAQQLWPSLSSIVHQINCEMNKFLELFGVRSNHSSPFCSDFEDENELCELLENACQKTTK